MKTIIKAVSIFLVALMVIQLLPFTTMAKEYNEELAREEYLRETLSDYLYDLVDTKNITEILQPEPYISQDNPYGTVLTLKNKKGENVSYIFSEPVAFFDSEGKLQYKEISIGRQTDAKAVQDGYAYTNGTNDYRINFAEDAATGIQVQKNSVSWNLSVNKVDKKTTGELLSEKIDNKDVGVFNYENAFGRDTILKYYPQLNGVKEDIILNRYIGINEFSFSLVVENGYAVLNEDNTVTIHNKTTGKIVDTFTPPYACDSIEKEDETSPAQHYVDCEYSLEEVGEGEYLFSIIVPKAFLEAETTVYPVIIDPTTSSIYQSLDTPVYSGYPTSSYSSNVMNCFGRASGYGYGRVLTKFSIPSAIKNYATISSAYLWVRELTGRTGTTYVRPHMNTTSFTSSTTWNTKPSYDTNTSMSNKNINSNSQDGGPSVYWYKFDIAYAVRKWTTGTTNNGLSFISNEETNGAYNWRGFASAEHGTSSYHPYAVITYTNDTTPPTITSVTGNPTNWTKNNVTLTVNAMDNASGVKHYSFDNGSTWQTVNTKSFSSNQTVNIKVKDNAGNISAATTVTISKIDKVKPEVSYVTQNPSTWTNGNITLTVTATDNASGAAYYSFDQMDTWQKGNIKTVSANGLYSIYVKDAAGNISSYSYLELVNKIDKVAPTINSVTGNSTSWTNQNVTLTVNASDNASGVAYYSFDNGSTWQTSNSKTFSSNQTVNIKVKDKAGNISSATSVVISKIDKSTPSQNDIIIIIDPPTPTSGSVTITVNVINSESGIAGYSFDNGNTWSNSNTTVINSNQAVYIKVKENSGNISPSYLVNITNIDKTAPVINGVTVTMNGDAAIVSVSASDSQSGVAWYSFDNGTTWQVSSTKTYTEYNNCIKIKVKDAVGNVCTYSSDVNNDIVPPATPYAFVSGDLLEIRHFNDGLVFAPEHFEYKLGSANDWQTLTDDENVVRIVCTEDTVVYIKAVDDAGNETPGTSVVMKANVGIYASTKDDLRNGDFMLPSGFIRTYNGNTKDWFFAFNANIQSECNGKALKYTDFYGNEAYYMNDADNTTKYYSVSAAEITAENGTVQITDTVSIPYAYKLKSEKGDVYFNAAGKICAVIDGNQKVHYNWSSTSLVISDNHNRTYTVNFIDENPVSITDCANHTVTYTWTNGKLTAVVNALNQTEAYAYDASGRLIQNGTESVAYTTDGRTAQITQQTGSFLKYTYNDTYTENNKLGRVQISDGRGVSVFYAYADGFTVGQEISVYEDSAVYAGAAASVVFQNADHSGCCAAVEFVNRYNPSGYAEYERLQFDNTYYYMQYDSNGNITGIVTVQYGENDEIAETYEEAEVLEQATEKVTSTYINNILTESISWVRVNNGWGYESKVSYTYTNDLLSFYAKYIFENSDWRTDYTETYSYDIYGNICETVTADYSVSSTVYTTTQRIFDSLNHLTSETYYTGTELDYTNMYTYDALGRSVSVSYNGDTVSYTYNADGNITSYTYNNETVSFNYANGNLLSYTDAEGITKTYTYDAYGNAVGVSFDIYSLEYNTLGNLTKANINNTELVSFSYAGVMQDISSEAYANGQTVTYAYNNDGNIASVSLNNTPVYAYAYSTQNDTDVITVTDNAGNLTKTISGDLTTVSSNGNPLYSIENHYGASGDNDFYGKVYTFGGSTYTLVSEDEKDAFKTGSVTAFEKEYTYDEDHNLTQSSIENILTAVLGYTADGAITSYANTLAAVTQSYAYLYDADGNITSATKTVSQNNTTQSESISYTYDAKNQLTSAETDSVKWTYAYDNRGNITEKKTYALSGGTQTLVDTDTFGYTNTAWQDELTSFNNQSITYDAAGNPTSYKGTTLTWTMGRQLASFDGISYTYNEDGIRTSKTANGVTTRYYLDGTKVIGQTDGTNTLYFRYDSSNSLTSVIFNGTEFFYLKNGLGDITGLADANGNIVAEYAYDPWGKVLSVTGANTALANANPFRYRSYYYDSDSGMYYLESRYYDPEICRFINADEIKYTVYGNNLFAYCNNNAVILSDELGTKEIAGNLPSYKELLDVLQELGMLGGVISAIAAFLVLLFAIISAISSSSTTTISGRRILPNTKKELPSGRVYQLAFINTNGALIRMNKDYSFTEIVGLLGISGVTNLSRQYVYDKGNISPAKKMTTSNRSCKGGNYWGVYTHDQAHACALAYVFSCDTPPEVEQSGMYGHYHDKTHSFHIWFGGILNY